jgi:ABC-type multidrug transport system fused ATPase/permease subunit
VRQDFVGILMVFGTCLLCVVYEKTLPPAAAGLAISNSFQILLFLTLMVQAVGVVHSNMHGVERVRALGATPPEVDATQRAEPPAAHWPVRGEIEFCDVVMSYLPASPHVLKGVSFRVLSGEKIGVVGRTGAGKSSLIQALFRLAPASSGCIRIDGVDIARLTLDGLRRSIAILPQEPVMFQGTLRSNLDPFDQHGDAALADALRQCLLGDMLSGHALGLLQPVASSGNNFSLGQQQLVCLARALLNQSKVLLLDEATAALDSATDSKVQRVLRSAFASRTILTIAHRIETIIDSDRILVMDAGRVVEFASPTELLESESGVFAQLCRQSGSASFSTLRAAALRHSALIAALESEVRAANAAVSGGRSRLQSMAL